ncbi:TPA: accessory Sec system protein Asp3 [Streptococcus agalactiae]
MERQSMGSITWRPGPGIYLYGSQIDYFRDKVRYYNPLLASGKRIKTWHSRTNFQGNRVVPDLPLLVPKERYQLVSHYKTVPEDRLHIVIYFYNRQGKEIEFIAFRDGLEEFICPEDNFTYCLVLVAAGCKELEFHSIDFYHLDAQEPLNQTVDNRSLTAETLPSEFDLIRDLVN